MIRVLLGAVLPLLGLALAAGFVAPSVVASGGEPMIVAGAAPATFEPAAFKGSGCASTLLYAEPAEPTLSELRIVALDVQRGPRGMTLRFREVPPGGTLGDAAFVLLVDASGLIIAAKHPEALEPDRVDGVPPRPCELPEGELVGAI